MTESKINEECFFEEIMGKSKLEVPFSDFEEKAMTKIFQKFELKKSIYNELKLSWVFFVLGSIFGLALSFLIPKISFSIFSLKPADVALIFQISFIVLFFVQGEYLLRVFRNFKAKP